MRCLVCERTIVGLCVVMFGLIGCQTPQVPQAEPGKAYGDPLRFEQAVIRFEKQDERSPPPINAVVCVGSSSVRMWHGELANDLAPLTVIPRGFGGSNMNDLLHYADRLVLKHRPRAVLIYEGDNDIAQGVSPGQVVDTFEALVLLIHEELPACRVYLLAIKPSPKRWALWPKMQEANRLLAKACGGDDRLTFIDIASPMLGASGEPRPELYVNDQLHMSRLGYEVWREAVRPVLVEAERGLEPSERAISSDPAEPEGHMPNN